MSALSPDEAQAQVATRKALQRLLAVSVSFAALALVTYLVPRSERLRPWVAGEGIPIARAFTEDAHTLPGFAEANAAPASEPTAVAAVESPVLGGPDEAPPPPAAGAGLRIDPSEYEGVQVLIEQPAALAGFFAQLTKVGKREPKTLVRVAHYGDSAVASDGVTATMRRKLQRRFGDGGHGFVLIARGDMHYNHRDVVHRSSSGWELHSTTVGALKPGFYGYGGVQARGKGGESAFFSTMGEGALGRNVSRFELFYQRFRGGGAVEIKVDGKRHKVLETRADKPEDGFEVIPVPDGAHSLSIKPVGSQVRLYGVTLEREGPGVVYDSLGLVGARADRLLYIDGAHLQRQMAQRSPHMFVLAFGGNESANRWLNLERYEAELADVVKHVRAGRPQSACLMFAPLDQAERDQRGRVVTVPVLPKIVAIQRKVALANGCAFFDAFAAMGGPGSMAKWLKMKPKLATSDMRHATPEGYDLIGQLYYKALLKAFADYLAANKGSA